VVKSFTTTLVCMLASFAWISCLTYSFPLSPSSFHAGQTPVDPRNKCVARLVVYPRRQEQQRTPPYSYFTLTRPSIVLEQYPWQRLRTRAGRQEDPSAKEA
jgi:hypothetical protein